MKAREGSRRFRDSKKRLAPRESRRKNVWRRQEFGKKTPGVQRVNTVRKKEVHAVRRRCMAIDCNLIPWENYYIMLTGDAAENIEYIENIKNYIYIYIYIYI